MRKSFPDANSIKDVYDQVWKTHQIVSKLTVADVMTYPEKYGQENVYAVVKDISNSCSGFKAMIRDLVLAGIIPDYGGVSEWQEEL